MEARVTCNLSAEMPQTNSDRSSLALASPKMDDPEW